MYHALVSVDGEWASFGLHLPSQWTKVFHALQREHGPDNVRYLFWEYDERLGHVGAVIARLEYEVRMANQAQRQWNRGELSGAADEEGNLHLSTGMHMLRAAAT